MQSRGKEKKTHYQDSVINLNLTSCTICNAGKIVAGGEKVPGTGK